MIILIIFIGLAFLACAFLLTEDNAKTYLAGYNTMSDVERASVNLKELIAFNKKFHVVIGLSTIIIGLLITYFFGGTAGILFVSLFPIFAYVYYVVRMGSFIKKRSLSLKWLSISILLLTSIGVGSVFYYGNRPNEIRFDDTNMTITGPYGDQYPIQLITEMKIVDRLPSIKLKKHGYATGEIRKGKFKTDDCKDITVITDNSGPPYLFINLNGEDPIYYCQEGVDLKAFITAFNNRN